MSTLKKLREAAGLTQKEVAEKLGVVENAIGNYERGIRMINIRQVLQLAEMFEISAEDVIAAQLNSINIGQSD